MSANDIHEFEAMVGTEIRKTWEEKLYSAGYGFDRKTLTTKPIIFPEESQAFKLHEKAHVENAYVSAFSTLSYSLLNRYTLGGYRFNGPDLFRCRREVPLSAIIFSQSFVAHLLPRTFHGNSQIVHVHS